MSNSKAKLPIGVFDSGIGGISVLAEIIKMLPHEEFIYYADTLHSPYGSKSEEVVRSLSIRAAEFLSRRGIKSLVVACNTATCAAIAEIRKMFSFPVIGMEPAIKPAVESKPGGKILVMATPLTLKSRKFHELVCRYKHLAGIVPLPCPGLVDIIEHGHIQGQVIQEYLSPMFSQIHRDDVSTVVLGCTHYVLIKGEILKVVGENITVIDGNFGTSKRLRNVLRSERLLAGTDLERPQFPIKAKVRFHVSGHKKEVITLCRRLLQSEGIICEEVVSFYQ